LHRSSVRDADFSQAFHRSFDTTRTNAMLRGWPLADTSYRFLQCRATSRPTDTSRGILLLCLLPLLILALFAPVEALGKGA
jgi:hypothetical protein